MRSPLVKIKSKWIPSEMERKFRDEVLFGQQTVGRVHGGLRGILDRTRRSVPGLSVTEKARIDGQIRRETGMSVEQQAGVKRG